MAFCSISYGLLIFDFFIRFFFTFDSKLNFLFTEESMPEYDEATKALIAAADKARQEFDEGDKQVRELEAEQR